MDRRIDELDWMAPETKVKAHAKLAAFTPKIGYPDQWRDYSALDDRAATTLLGNAMRADRVRRTTTTSASSASRSTAGNGA